MAGKVGRPPKERFEYVGACVAPINDAERDALKRELMSVDGVARLPPRQRVRMLKAMEMIVIDYRLMAELNRKRRSSQGNKTKAHISFLLYRCAEVWCSAARVARVPLWERDAGLGGGESTPVQIARLCLQVATGKIYAASLRRQIAGATRWSRLPKKAK